MDFHEVMTTLLYNSPILRRGLVIYILCTDTDIQSHKQFSYLNLTGSKAPHLKTRRIQGCFHQSDLIRLFNLKKRLITNMISNRADGS